jgi:hypothetical protein
MNNQNDLHNNSNSKRRIYYQQDGEQRMRRPQAFEIEQLPHIPPLSTAVDPLSNDAHCTTTNTSNDDNADDNDSRGSDEGEGRPRRRRPSDPCWVVTRYLFLSLLALGLTVTCPQSNMYRRPSSRSQSTSTGQLQLEPLVQCLVGYVLTIVLFFSLRGTDPGFLTPETIKDMNIESMTLLHHDGHDEEKQQKVQSKKQHQEEELDLSEAITGTSSSLDHHRHIAQKSMIPQKDEPSTTHQPTDVPTTCTTDIHTGLFQGTHRRYCPTCQISPLLRSHHCKICKKCVATFDHHCDFVGTCIGERNHCRFWWFLLAQAIAFAIFCHVISSSTLGLGSLLSAGASPFPWASLHVVLAKFYIYPINFFAWIMVVMHSWMALTNSTTFECSKGPRHLEYLKGTQPLDLPFSKVHQAIRLLFLWLPV